MNVIHLSGQEQFKKEVLEYKGVCVVDFWAEWCGPCRMLGPIMEELAHDNTGKDVKIIKINVDENPDLAGAFQVMSIPTVYLMLDGKPVDLLVGVNPKGVYQNKINDHLAKMGTGEEKIAA